MGAVAPVDGWQPTSSSPARSAPPQRPPPRAPVRLPRAARRANRVVAAAASAASSVVAAAGGGGGAGIGGQAASQFAQLNAADQAALLNANSSVLTDPSPKLGPAGTKFVHDFFVPGTLITFPQAAIQQIASIGGVQSAVARPLLSRRFTNRNGPHDHPTPSTHRRVRRSPRHRRRRRSPRRSALPSSAASRRAADSPRVASPARDRALDRLPVLAAAEVTAGVGRFGAAFQKCLPRAHAAVHRHGRRARADHQPRAQPAVNRHPDQDRTPLPASTLPTGPQV